MDAKAATALTPEELQRQQALWQAEFDCAVEQRAAERGIRSGTMAFRNLSVFLQGYCAGLIMARRGAEIDIAQEITEAPLPPWVGP